MHVPSKLDALDRRILASLAEDGRMTNVDLAQKVGISASQCSRRRSRLEEDNVIIGYRAEIGTGASQCVTAFANISVSGHSAADRGKLHRLLLQHPAVRSCHAVTGDADYIVRLEVADLNMLNSFIETLLDGGEKFLQVKSMIALATIKDGISPFSS